MRSRRTSVTNTTLARCTLHSHASACGTRNRLFISYPNSIWVCSLEIQFPEREIEFRDCVPKWNFGTRKQAQTRLFDVNQLYLGHYYSNNEHGDHWAVRQIIDESHHDDPEKDLLIYKVVAGDHYRQTAIVSHQQFARWAKHQVKQENE